MNPSVIRNYYGEVLTEIAAEIHFLGDQVNKLVSRLEQSAPVSCPAEPSRAENAPKNKVTLRDIAEVPELDFNCHDRAKVNRYYRSAPDTFRDIELKVGKKLSRTIRREIIKISGVSLLEPSAVSPYHCGHYKYVAIRDIPALERIAFNYVRQ